MTTVVKALLTIWLASTIVLGASISSGAQTSVRPSDWNAYMAAFVDPEGRVIDTGNGGISHSEGQGYGLILAYLANDPAGFDKIWSFTRTEMLLRDDGLSVWRWDPNADPHVTDPNNATDGDILIAYALALAGETWDRADLTEAATTIATAVGGLIREHQGRTILLPGSVGYGRDDRPDGPVVNLSYWIFEAFPVLARLAPDAAWDQLSKGGVALIEEAKFGPRALPPEWLSLASRPKPAEGFAAEFGYNVLRIPLYLARGGIEDRELLSRLRDGMTNDEGHVGVIDLSSGAFTTVLTDPGYAILPAVLSCVLDGTPIAPDLRTFVPTLYYPSTLHLLGLAYLTEHHPECLR